MNEYYLLIYYVIKEEKKISTRGSLNLFEKINEIDSIRNTRFIFLYIYSRVILSVFLLYIFDVTTRRRENKNCLSFLILLLAN
jgi:hypothetical protein